MSAGYLRPLWLPPEEEYLPPGVPPFVPTGVAPIPGIPGDLPPEAPVYEAPELSGPAPLSFRDRLGLSMGGVPQFNGPLPQETGLQAFARGLVGGVGAGMSTATAAGVRQRETARTEGNAVRKSESDRNYVNAIETWRAKLKDHYRLKEREDGKQLVSKQAAADMGRPELAGEWLDPLQIADRLHVARSAAKVPADLAETMGLPAGAETTTAAILEARRLLRPGKPTKPRAVSPSESRRKMVGGVVADLFRAGRTTKADVQEYLNTPGVVDTLAAHGITPADLLREFP